MPFRTEEDGGQIKPPNYNQSYTEDQVRELIKCSSDCSYFLENYGYIIHPTKGKVPFKLYDYQKKMVHNFAHYNRVISCISRQSGKCVTGDTVITRDDNHVEIEGLIRDQLTIRERFVSFLERLLIKCYAYRIDK